MKRVNLINVFSWFLTHISWLTMVFSPIAYGLQAEKKTALLTSENLKSYAQEFGLNQKITLSDFFEKTKAYYPGYMYKEIEAFVQKNPNMIMPQVEIKTLKSTNGEVVPTILFIDKDKTQTVQFYTDSDKFLKMNGVFLTEKETQLPEKMFQKLLSADLKLKTNYTEALATEKAQKNPFTEMNSKLWKTLTIEQRATYIIQMRKMYLDAEKVISGKESVTKEQSLNKKPRLPFFEYIFKSILSDVEAFPAKVSRPVSLPQAKGKIVTTKQGDRVQIPYDAKSCLVAGYLGAYTTAINNIRGDKRPGCSVDVAIATYADSAELKYVKKSNDQCVSSSGTSFVACNPMIYGFPGGNPICIDKKSASFQIATHWDGPCDSQSRLSKNHPLFDLAGKDYSKIQPREKQVDQIKKDQADENFQLTKDFISGVLTSHDPQLLALFKNGEWSPELEKEIHRIGDHFKASIDKALEICEKEITLKHEANQRGACDQLHRRYLFVDEVLAGLKKPQIPLAILPVAEPKAEAAPVSKTCSKPDGISNYNYEKCECSKGTLEIANEPGKIAKFFGAKSPDKGQEKYECKSGPNWWLLGGLALGGLALWALLNRHNSKQVYVPPAAAVIAPLCPQGTTGTPPNCFSAALCPPGTTGNSPNCFVAAQCPVGTTGVAPNCYLPPQCRAPQVVIGGLCTCANVCTGLAVINPNTCICTAPPPTEGGTGVNTCLQPPCNGGVPAVQ